MIKLNKNIITLSATNYPTDYTWQDLANSTPIGEVTIIQIHEAGAEPLGLPVSNNRYTMIVINSLASYGSAILLPLNRRLPVYRSYKNTMSVWTEWLEV